MAAGGGDGQSPRVRQRQVVLAGMRGKRAAQGRPKQNRSAESCRGSEAGEMTASMLSRVVSASLLNRVCRGLWLAVCDVRIGHEHCRERDLRARQRLE